MEVRAKKDEHKCGNVGAPHWIQRLQTERKQVGAVRVMITTYYSAVPKK